MIPVVTLAVILTVVVFTIAMRREGLRLALIVTAYPLAFLILLSCVVVTGQRILGVS